MINKKIVLAILLLVLFTLMTPLLLSLLFSTQTRGKIIVEQTIDAPYLSQMSKDMELVFFGYVGCTNVCTPMLERLSDFYDSEAFRPLKPYVGFTFVNLKSDVKADQPGIFARAFNSSFEGVYLTQRQVMEIDRDFSLFFSKSLNDPGEINHSDYVYLIERGHNGDVRLLAMYMTHPLNSDMIIDDIRACRKGNP